MKKSGYDMLYLIGCALNGEKPDVQRVETMELSEIYTMAKQHSLIMCVIRALEEVGVSLEKEWVEKKEKAIRNNLLFEAEYQTVKAYFESQKIWYMPLKGWILKEYYPKKGMRQMADIDILFDEAYRNQVKDYFEGRGYECEVFGQSNHDVYLKPPVYNFEMHVGLYGDTHNEAFYEYYKAVKERLIKRDVMSYEYQFLKEDFYIYFLSHVYKHYCGGGTGIRSLVDCYVFLHEEEQNMNWRYLWEEMDKLGLCEFEEEMRNLSKKVFEMNKCSQLSYEEEKKIEYYLFSGTYGTMRHRVENKVQKLKEGRSMKQAKWAYLKDRLFPSRSVLEVYCPAAKKYRVLLLFAWGKRVLRGVAVSKDSIKKELQYLNTVKEKSV